MKMDITSQFKHYVEIAESDQNKKANKEELELDDVDQMLLPDKNRIMPKAKRKKSKNIPKDPFETKAKTIVTNITKLREFLAESRSAYIDVLNITGTTGNDESLAYRDTVSSGFSDLDRDKIDEGANVIIRNINKLITKFKSDLKEQLENKGKYHLTANQTQHLESVCDILESYLRNACQYHAKQKAIRVEKELELQKLSRLELNVKANPDSYSAKKIGDLVKRRDQDDQSLNSNSEIDSDSNAFHGDWSGDSERSRGINQRKQQTRSKKSNHDPLQPNNEDQDIPVSENPLTNESIISNVNSRYQYSSDDDAENKVGGDDSLSPEEIQAYEQENEAMYEDLVSLRDNIQQIENKVVKIAQLQEVFTEKVLQQKDDIDLIASHAVSATENMTDANEELRKAIQRNASLRVYILFFLLVMSFTLIFLDWYNE